jgi:hypothetical protein
MKAYQCICRQPLFFENTTCVNCGAAVGYDPTSRVLGPLKRVKNGLWSLARDARRPRPRFRFCANREGATTCNWLVPAEAADTLCLSCRLTRRIPILDRPKNPERLRELEVAKRRVLFALQNLGLPLITKAEDEAGGLAFDFLESLPDQPPVMTGHADGVITLNVAEADSDYREKNRDALHEPYRTIIGHLRHELGHYYWDVLEKRSAWLPRFRALFGDEQADYGAALKRHYADGPPPDWRTRFISAYAASHPWEDWAETWAHYMHMRATLETASAFGLDTSRARLRLDPFGADVLYGGAELGDGEAFLAAINGWVLLTTVVNEVSRSMGQPDLYPFVLSAAVVTKLHFVHCVIHAWRIAAASPQPEARSAPLDPLLPEQPTSY